MMFKKSSDTLVIENMLGGMQVGDVVTYDQISHAIGRDLRKFARPSLYAALKSLVLDKQMVFECVMGVGYKRLADNEIVDASKRDRRRIYRASKRAIGKLACVKFDSLEDDQKRQHVAASAQLGAIAMFAHKSAGNKIEKKVEDRTVLPIGETLKLFSG